MHFRMYLYVYLNIYAFIVLRMCMNDRAHGNFVCIIARAGAAI